MKMEGFPETKSSAGQIVRTYGGSAVSRGNRILEMCVARRIMLVLYLLLVIGYRGCPESYISYL